MKIRLASIQGRIADPLYNEAKMEEAVSKAIEEGFDAIVFPSDAIVSESIGSSSENEDFISAVREAFGRFWQFRNKHCAEIQIAYSEAELKVGSFRVIVRNTPELESIESTFAREASAKAISLKNQCVAVYCQGNGTETGCSGIYSNQKIVAWKGDIVASSVYEDVVDADLRESEQDLRLPYLKAIPDKMEFFKRCVNLQSMGLEKKLKSMGRDKITIGVSGGLDSTVSLLICVHAFKRMGLPLSNIIGVTMPGLGTTKDTYEKALELMSLAGVTALDIDLRPLLKEHLENIKQPKGVYDVTYEQTQSRERTQVLLDLANKENAVMVGTGCMSEFALGWMTYGGDHLSMYAINVGLPKTLVKAYAQWLALECEAKGDAKMAELVLSILNRPVSPELLPIDENGEQHEKTESIIGDYKTLDFYIYHTIKSQWGIRKIFEKAKEAFPEYDSETLLKWLDTFVTRFYTRQYKKNCYGDGMQLLDWSVSPFKGFKMPSDIGNDIWKKELEALKKEILG